MTISEIEAGFQSLCPSERGCDWDNDGLLVCSDRDKEVKTVITCLDVTFSVIERAIQEKAELIISHHPLIFKPIPRIDQDSLVSRKIILLLSHGISLLSLHTRLDGAVCGLNDFFAESIGVSKDHSLVLCSDEPNIGGVGVLSQRISSEEFARRISKALRAPISLYSARNSILRVGFCCGGGKDFLSNAFELGCDAYVSGDLGYHAVQEMVERGMTVIDCGHFASEKNVVFLLRDFLVKMNANLHVIPVLEDLGGKIFDFS